MIHNLMRNLAIILQDVVILEALRDGDFLGHREHLVQLVVGHVVQFCAVVFGYDELWAY